MRISHIGIPKLNSLSSLHILSEEEISLVF